LCSEEALFKVFENYNKVGYLGYNLNLSSILNRALMEIEKETYDLKIKSALKRVLKNEYKNKKNQSKIFYKTKNQWDGEEKNETSLIESTASDDSD